MKLSLYCVPYAGASASIYNGWKNHLSDFINLIPVELPGRGLRITEKYITNIQGIVDDIYNSIKREISEHPYAFFGYSLGSWIVFELCLKIKNEKIQAPCHVFFAAKEPPYLKIKEGANYLLSDDEFIEKILKNGGTPSELLEDKDFIDFLLPTMRADYEVLDKYICDTGVIVLNSGITIFNGDLDTIIDNKKMDDWKGYTMLEFNRIDFNDGHFFIHNNTEKIINEVNQKLAVQYNNVLCNNILHDFY